MFGILKVLRIFDNTGYTRVGPINLKTCLQDLKINFNKIIYITSWSGRQSLNNELFLFHTIFSLIKTDLKGSSFLGRTPINGV